VSRVQLPPPGVVEDRLQWFQNARRAEGFVGNGDRFSMHSLLLLTDIEKSFCVGAWLSVIVLAYAVVDSTLRDLSSGSYKAKAQGLYSSDPELEWLRELRNQIVHVSPPGTASILWKLPPIDLSACHGALEADARRAVSLAFRQVFASAVA